MPRKDRKITDTDRGWYRLGLLENVQAIKAAYARGWQEGWQEGRQEAVKQLENRIEKVCATNHQLLIEMLRLGRDEPLVGVLLTYDFANLLIQRLRKFDKNSWHASRLKHYINNADAAWCEALENLEDELKRAGEE